jgi:transposase
MAVEALARPMATFLARSRLRRLAGAGAGSTFDSRKQRFGRTSKMGQRDIRRLLIIGAMSVIHWASRRGARPGSGLALTLGRKPLMLVAMALANKMARFGVGNVDEEKGLPGSWQCSSLSIYSATTTP